MFFYSNEMNEPPHIHAEKAEMEAKFWLDVESFEIRAVFLKRMKSRDERELRKIIYLHIEYIIEQWNIFHGKN